jgi:hypothetical protein
MTEACFVTSTHAFCPTPQHLSFGIAIDKAESRSRPAKLGRCPFLLVCPLESEEKIRRARKREARAAGGGRRREATTLVVLLLVSRLADEDTPSDLSEAAPACGRARCLHRSPIDSSSWLSQFYFRDHTIAAPLFDLGRRAQSSRQAKAPNEGSAPAPTHTPRNAACIASSTDKGPVPARKTTIVLVPTHLTPQRRRGGALCLSVGVLPTF